MFISSWYVTAQAVVGLGFPRTLDVWQNEQTGSDIEGGSGRQQRGIGGASFKGVDRYKLPCFSAERVLSPL